MESNHSEFFLLKCTLGIVFIVHLWLTSFYVHFYVPSTFYQRTRWFLQSCSVSAFRGFLCDSAAVCGGFKPERQLVNPTLGVTTTLCSFACLRRMSMCLFLQHFDRGGGCRVLQRGAASRRWFAAFLHGFEQTQGVSWENIFERVYPPRQIKKKKWEKTLSIVTVCVGFTPSFGDSLRCGTAVVFVCLW